MRREPSIIKSLVHAMNHIFSGMGVLTIFVVTARYCSLPVSNRQLPIGFTSTSGPLGLTN